MAKGSGDSLLDVAGVDSLAGAVDDPVTAVQWSKTFACEDLAMASADEDDQRDGEQLVAKAGKVSPLDGLVMAQHADRSIIIGMHFETSEQASENLQTRVDLASGDAPGQGGSFNERFKVTSGHADGRTSYSSSGRASSRCSPTSRTAPCSSRPADLPGARHTRPRKSAG